LERGKSDRDRVGADFSPLAGFPAGAKIFDPGRPKDLQSGAILGSPILHQGANARRFGLEFGDATRLGQQAGLFHHLPSTGIHQNLFGKLHELHPVEPGARGIFHGWRKKDIIFENIPTR